MVLQLSSAIEGAGVPSAFGVRLSSLIQEATTTTTATTHGPYSHHRHGISGSTNAALELARGGETVVLSPDSSNNPVVSSELETKIRILLALLEQWWYTHIPSIVRYLVSGNLGNLCFYLCERYVARTVDDHYHLLPELAQQFIFDLSVRDSLSFILAYIVHIPAQHYLHAVFVYGLHTIDTTTKYWATLGGTYSALMTSCLGSTVLHHVLIQAFGTQYKTIIFVTTLWTFSIFNYFVIGWIVRRAELKSTTTATTTPSVVETSLVTDTTPLSSTDGTNTAEGSIATTQSPTTTVEDSATTPDALTSPENNPLLESTDAVL